MSSTYLGTRDGNGNPVVYKDGKRFSAKRSQRVWNHSPTGFEWGFGGSGPAQLALALLLDFTRNESLAVDYHQQFKWEVVARMPESGWCISAGEIEEWLRKAIDTDGLQVNGELLQ